MGLANKALFFFLFSAVAFHGVYSLVSEACLTCICKATTSCQITNTPCNGYTCGPFRITKPYWEDGGQYTVNGESPNSKWAFTNCVKDVTCSAATIRGMMNKYQRDCNRDGKIDCDDFAAIHQLGYHQCHFNLPSGFKATYQQCKNTLGSYQKILEISKDF